MKIIIMYAGKPAWVEPIEKGYDFVEKITRGEIPDMAAMPMMAAVPIVNNIAQATKPVKDLLIGLADPICYIVFAWGLLECMLGKGSSGIQRMKYATLGFIGMNWIPVFMDILRGAKPL